MSILAVDVLAVNNVFEGVSHICQRFCAFLDGFYGHSSPLSVLFEVFSSTCLCCRAPTLSRRALALTVTISVSRYRKRILAVHVLVVNCSLRPLYRVKSVVTLYFDEIRGINCLAHSI